MIRKIWPIICAIGVLLGILGYFGIQPSCTKSKTVIINNYINDPLFAKKVERDNIKKKYPFGFVIFAADGTDIYLPKKLNFTEHFEIDWGNAEIKELTSKKIEIYLPKIYYKPQSGTIQNFTMVIPRQVGYKKAFPISFATQNFKPIFEVLEDHRNFVVLIIGFQ